MSSNVLGTVLRIALIAFGLFSFWFVSVGMVYLIISLIFGFEFSFKIWVIVFSMVVFFRMFYPKNVFI